MSLTKLFVVFFTIIFSLTVKAQKAPDEKIAEKSRKVILIEQIVADTQNLKLPENRAFVFAQAGNLMRQSDAIRARQLFQNAVLELINAQTFAEADRKKAPYYYDLLNSQNLRPQILNTIAYQDADFALESLYRTRPTNITKALAAFSPNNQKNSAKQAVQGNVYLAQNEINLEQRIMSLAADQNPERILEILEKSLEKGISGETLTLLKKLNLKNPAKTQEILSAVSSKLLKLDYNVEDENSYIGTQNFSVAINFLNDYIRDTSGDDNALKYNEGQYKNLANIIISAALKAENPNVSYTISSIVPIAEKLFPERVTSLKESQKKLSRYQRHDFGRSFPTEASELLKTDVSPEKLISEAVKFSPNVRSHIYQQAAQKYAGQGNFALAEKILNDNLSDAQLENALNNLNWQKANNAINEGNFNEALNLINRLPENSRINAFTSLVDRIFRQNPVENKSLAVSILEQAHSLIGEKPENTNEMNGLLQIISKYAEIEPSQAFRLFDTLVFQINELSEAAILINGFNGNGQIRQGEIIMTQGNSTGIYLGELDTPLRIMVKADFDRTMEIINRFGRREARINLKLKLAQTID